METDGDHTTDSPSRPATRSLPLRKIIMVLAIGLGVWVYLQPERFQPVFRAGTWGWNRVRIAWNADEDAAKVMREWDGEVIRVPGGNVLELRAPDTGQSVQFILLGLEVPTLTKGIPQTSPQNSDWRRSKEQLEKLIGTNHVHLMAFASVSPSSETGFAFVGNRNLNAAMVASGAARFSEEHLEHTTTSIRIQMENALQTAAQSAGSETEARE